MSAIATAKRSGSPADLNVPFTEPLGALPTNINTNRGRLSRLFARSPQKVKAAVAQSLVAKEIDIGKETPLIVVPLEGEKDTVRFLDPSDGLKQIATLRIVEVDPHTHQATHILFSQLKAKHIKDKFLATVISELVHENDLFHVDTIDVSLPKNVRRETENAIKKSVYLGVEPAQTRVPHVGHTQTKAVGRLRYDANDCVQYIRDDVPALAKVLRQLEKLARRVSSEVSAEGKVYSSSREVFGMEGLSYPGPWGYNPKVTDPVVVIPTIRLKRPL